MATNPRSEGDTHVTEAVALFEHLIETGREEGSVTPQDAPPQDGRNVSTVPAKERSAVYTAAMARLREKYRMVFDGYLQEGYTAIGVAWTPPRKAEYERDRAELLRLLNKHPELRDLVAIGADPANQDAQP
jgi:hypothetical protein